MLYYIYIYIIAAQLCNYVTTECCIIYIYIYIIATQLCNYVTTECCIILQMDKRLPRISHPRSRKSQERSEVFWKSTVCVSLVPMALLPEALSRLQEFGICSAMLPWGQQRKSIDSLLSLCCSRADIFVLEKEAENVVACYIQEKEKSAEGTRKPKTYCGSI